MKDAAALSAYLSMAIEDKRVLAAIAKVPRDRFVRDADLGAAYDNVALPIDCGQTISQPVVVGRMLELLELQPSDTVLDVGTGSGYHAALLASLTAHVWTIERHPELSAEAERTIRSLGIVNIDFVVGDGTVGDPRHAPFDAINVAAAAGAEIPPALAGQLAEGGRLVAPVGVSKQRLTVVRKARGQLVATEHEPVRFVPLIAG